MCQCLIQRINSEYEEYAKTTSTHKFAVKEIALKEFGIHINQRITRSNKVVEGENEQFDLNKHMSTNDHSQLDSNQINEDNPLLLLIRCMLDATHLNSQEVKFGDTLSVPTNDGQHTLQYALTGYVLFVGDTKKRHYEVVCKGKNDCWFQYNDETTECKNPFELDHYIYKRQVVFLLYAEMSYCNGTMECSAAD